MYHFILDLRGCTENELNDFKYSLIWAGRDVYYSLVGCADRNELKRRLGKYVQLLGRNDGETFGYATGCVVTFSEL